MRNWDVSTVSQGDLFALPLKENNPTFCTVLTDYQDKTFEV